MAVNPGMVVRIAANLAELKANLAEGRNQIEMTTAGMQRLANSFSGDKLIQAAHNAAAAVHQIGGAAKLTEAEQARVNATVTRALQKYQALGQEAPQALRDLAAATQGVEGATKDATASTGRWASAWGLVSRFLPALTIAGAVGGIVKLGTAALESAGHISDLAGQTGLSTDAIQRMQAVANQTGTTVDAFTGATYKLGVTVDDLLG